MQNPAQKMGKRSFEFAVTVFVSAAALAMPSVAAAFAGDAAPNSVPAAAADPAQDPPPATPAEDEEVPEGSAFEEGSPGEVPASDEPAAADSELPAAGDGAFASEPPGSPQPVPASPPANPPTRNVRLVDAVVASVDGVPITYLDLRDFETGRGLLTPGAAGMSEQQFLDVMVEEALFQAEFEAAGIAVDDEDTEAYITRILEINKSSRPEVETALAEIGLSWDDYFTRMRFEVQKLALINREVRTRANVTDEDVERYWKTAPEYQLDPRVVVSHIYIPVSANSSMLEVAAAEERAKEAWEMANESSFEKAAEKYSEGPTADKGGKLGEFEYGTMAPHFEAQIDKLDEGEHSEPFAAGGAIHIIRVDEIKSSGRVELVEVQEEIREKLYDELLDERFRRWVNEDLYERHHVTKQLDDLDDLVARSRATAASS